MEIYAAPKLSKYMTALGANNVKSFTYEINPHTHTHIHTHKHTHTHTPHMCACTHTRMHKPVVRNSYWGKYIRETRMEGSKLCWKRWVFKACLNDVWESEWRYVWWGDVLPYTYWIIWNLMLVPLVLRVHIFCNSIRKFGMLHTQLPWQLS